ncbi:hypothetical protein C7M84_003196 [Penaeus vannamei]|uniref:DAGKc domain-containing protein n=1 Tax=Penaeus vannamei TaxID=6689 RepID=A0A423TNV0_PENVA|nr:hypothetical protein C7M84_003196 [Penaeus vannamei]
MAGNFKRLPQRPRRLLVIINPVGGRKRAHHIYARRTKATGASWSRSTPSTRASRRRGGGGGDGLVNEVVTAAPAGGGEVGVDPMTLRLPAAHGAQGRHHTRWQHGRHLPRDPRNE